MKFVSVTMRYFPSTYMYLNSFKKMKIVATHPSSFFVVLDASDAVQSVLVDPSAPPDAHAVQDEARFDVHLLRTWITTAATN